METEEPTGYIPWDNFCRVVTEIMSGKYPAKDDEESLFRAFQMLDADKKGFLTPDELKRFMTMDGEPFTKEEMDEMLAACTDPTDNRIYYEDYVAILAK
jgi:Ca2+-binding EF-hand superfamily protein